MNKRKIAVGPGAASLILIAVVLALSVLTVLTMIAARNDEALTSRSVETRREVYGLFAAGETSLAKLDAVLVSCLADHPEDPDAYYAAVKEKLPDGMKMKGAEVSWTERTETRSLECAVRVAEPGAEKRTAWTLHRLNAGEIWEDEGFDDWGDEWDDEAWDDWEEEEESSEEESVSGDEEDEITDGAEESAPEADENTQDDGKEEFE